MERIIDAVGPGAQHDGKIVSTLLQLERDDPAEAFATLIETEKMCFDDYFRRLPG